MKKLLIFLLPVICININAQDTLTNKKTILFSPQHLINYGIRLDFERKIDDNKYLIIAPQLYLAEKKSNSEYLNTGRDDYNLMAGTGMTVLIKNFASNSCLGPYIGYGLLYNFFYTEYYEDVENDIEEVTGTIHKMGFDITIGYQWVLYDIVALDIYTGMAARKSFIYNGFSPDNKFDGYPSGFNHTGNILLLGVKVGIVY